MTVNNTRVLVNVKEHRQHQGECVFATEQYTGISAAKIISKILLHPALCCRYNVNMATALCGSTNAAPGLCTGEKDCFMTELMKASNEWSTRPDDERFLNLEDLRQSVVNRTATSWYAKPNMESIDLRLRGHQLEMAVERHDTGKEVLIQPSHFSFDQLCGYAGAPSSYLRGLPPELMLNNLRHGMEQRAVEKPMMELLCQSNGRNRLRALTTQNYGRIWDMDVVNAVIAANQDGRWQVPAASYATTDPKRATTLYAGDRDIFIFLVDPNSVVEVGNDQMFRGFFVWNSEVGKCTFGLTTFLYRYVCDNRIVWGASNIKELRIKHTAKAPERFAEQFMPIFNEYADSSTVKLVADITAAKKKAIPLGKDETQEQWFRKMGFTPTESKGAVQAALTEEGQCNTIWDAVNGVTAYARGLAYAGSRVELETRAGKLMTLAV